MAPVSGQEALKVLYKKGFKMRKGRGDHVVVSRDDVRPFVVPLKDELKRGTLNHIVKSSGNFKEDFDCLV